MNNGEAIIEIEEDRLVLDLFNGKYSNGKEIRKKVKTEDIENLIAQNFLCIVVLPVSDFP